MPTWTDGGAALRTSYARSTEAASGAGVCMSGNEITVVHERQVSYGP